MRVLIEVVVLANAIGGLIVFATRHLLRHGVPPPPRMLRRTETHQETVRRLQQENAELDRLAGIADDTADRFDFFQTGAPPLKPSDSLSSVFPPGPTGAWGMTGPTGATGVIYPGPTGPRRWVPYEKQVRDIARDFYLQHGREPDPEVVARIVGGGMTAADVSRILKLEPKEAP